MMHVLIDGADEFFRIAAGSLIWRAMGTHKPTLFPFSELHSYSSRQQTAYTNTANGPTSCEICTRSCVSLSCTARQHPVAVL